jgi:hypothetical protein
MVDEVYFEFEDSTGSLSGLHEIEEEESYSLIISQKAGLIRYRLGDRVRLKGSLGSCPGLEFSGRGPLVTDMVGEKLNEQFVAQCLHDLCPDQSSAAFLFPQREPDHYLLLLDSCPCPIEELEKTLEAALMKSFHYRHARRLGQLGRCRVQIRQNPAEEVDRCWRALGRRWGDMKAQVLQSVEMGAAYQKLQLQ